LTTKGACKEVGTSLGFATGLGLPEVATYNGCWTLNPWEAELAGAVPGAA